MLSQDQERCRYQCNGLQVLHVKSEARGFPQRPKEADTQHLGWREQILSAYRFDQLPNAHMLSINIAQDWAAVRYWHKL